MILRRLILSAVVVSGLVASAGVIVVGVVYAIFALLEPLLGSAGATASLVGIVAVILGGAAAILFVVSRPKKIALVVEPTPSPSPFAGIVDTVTDAVRERPAVVLLAAVGAGFLVIRNPQYLATALRAFVAPEAVED